MGLEFRSGGELIYYGIAPADGTQPDTGHWAIEGANRIRIVVDNPRIQPFVLEVISCDDDMLKVRQ
jgi:hypothetical protein